MDWDTVKELGFCFFLAIAWIGAWGIVLGAAYSWYNNSTQQTIAMEERVEEGYTLLVNGVHVTEFECARGDRVAFDDDGKNIYIFTK